MTDQGSLWRATHTDDVVPKLPPSSFGFSHASPEFWITLSNSAAKSKSRTAVEMFADIAGMLHSICEIGDVIAAADEAVKDAGLDEQGFAHAVCCEYNGGC